MNSHHAAILGKMYMHTLTCLCESQRCFFSPLSLKYIIYSFSLSPPFRLSSLPACRVSCCVLFRLLVACLVLSSVCSLAACCRLPSLLLSLCPHLARLGSLRRPSVCCRDAACLLCVVSPLAAVVTRQLSGARRCGSVDRCTAYMSPALSPLAHVLPWLVPWLPLSVPCVCPAVVCRLVVTIACTPQYSGRLRCGAASGV